MPLEKGITRDGSAVQFASVKLRFNKKRVLTAVTQNGLPLRFASPELQADKDVLTTAG